MPTPRFPRLPAACAPSKQAPRWSACISSAPRRSSCSARKRCCSRRDDGERRVAIHAGGILASASDGARIVTGGDDGRLVATTADGAHKELAADDKKRWIDQVALGPDGAVAWSAGKTAHVLTGKGEQRSFAAPSTVAGLAFAPKGFRLAIAHYNGATLWFPNAPAPRRRSSNGRARISPPPSARTAAFWSPPCRSRCCTAGGSPTASTCACRAIRRACARCPGPRTATSSPPPAPSSSSSGRSTARTVRWAGSRRILARGEARVCRGRLPSAPAGRRDWHG